MKIIFSIVFILFSTFTFSQGETYGRINIPFILSENGHIIIQAKVNGIEGSFVFDTGAGMNLLTQNFANKVKDLEKTHHFHTGHRATGEEITSDLWNSKTLEIGKFNISQEIFAVEDFDFPLDGLISLTPFLEKPVTIDFKNNVLRIESNKSLNKLIAEEDFELPLQISYDRGITIGIATKIQLNNKLPLNVNLDSGAGFNVYRFSSRYMESLGIDSTKLKSEYRPSYFRPQEGNTYYFTTLREMSDASKKVSISDFKVIFIEDLI